MKRCGNMRELIHQTAQPSPEVSLLLLDDRSAAKAAG